MSTLELNKLAETMGFLSSRKANNTKDFKITSFYKKNNSINNKCIKGDRGLKEK